MGELVDVKGLEKQFDLIKDVMPRWYIQSFDETKNAWQITPVGSARQHVFFLAMFYTEESAKVFLVQTKLRTEEHPSARAAEIDSDKHLRWFIDQVYLTEKRLRDQMSTTFPVAIEFKYNVAIDQRTIMKKEDFAFDCFHDFMLDCENRAKGKTVEVVPRYCFLNGTNNQAFGLWFGFGSTHESGYVHMLFTSKQKAELSLDIFLQSNRNCGAKKDEFKIHCLGEDLSVSDYLAAVERQIEDGKNVGYTLYCSRTVSNITSFSVAIDFMDWACARVSQIQTWMSFDELMIRYPELAIDSEKTVEVVPRYCIFVGGYALMRFNPSANIIAHMFFTDRAKLKRFCDELFMTRIIKCSKEDIKIYSLGEDLSIADYLVASVRHLQESHMVPFFISPEKLMECPVLIDMFDFSNDTDSVVDVVRTAGTEDLKVLVDKSLTLRELLLKYHKNLVMDYAAPEVMHYKGYTVFIHQYCQDGDYAGVMCKGTFNSREEAIGQDSLRVFDFFGTKENVERRIKAWIDQQVVIDEKNRIKDKRKAQREEQAEVNKPFKWFVPRKLVGWSAYGGAIENDGTIVKNSTEAMDYYVSISTVIGNLWDALGNRRWFVNGDIIKFIKHANVPDTRLDGLFFPYDCFYAIFENSSDPERRFMIRNRTIQYLRVVRVKSKQALKVVNALDIAPIFAPDKCIISIVTSTDSSKELFEGVIHIDINDSEKIPEGVGTPEEKAQIQRIVVALLLLYSGRVEIFKKYTIPRSQRYELNRGLANENKDNNEVITMMPLKKLVVEDSKPSDGTGSKKKTHMRGWCLDTLRHPRYRRNPDGTCKVRIRSPCVVNAIEE